MKRHRIKLVHLIALILILTISQATAAGPLTPTNAPAPTMKSLDEIYNKVDELSLDEITIPDVSRHNISTGIDVYLISNGDDILGSSTLPGREDAIIALGAEVHVKIPTDTQTGLPSGSRIHLPLVLTKYIDKATPLLYKALCQGDAIEAEIRFFQLNAQGNEEHYLTITLDNALIVDGASLSPRIETYSLAYETITWYYEEEEIEFTDMWVPSP